MTVFAYPYAQSARSRVTLCTPLASSLSCNHRQGQGSPDTQHVFDQQDDMLQGIDPFNSHKKYASDAIALFLSLCPQWPHDVCDREQATLPQALDCRKHCNKDTTMTLP